MRAVNWNTLEKDYNLEFWQQNIMQFWTDEEIPLSDDKGDWLDMNQDQKIAYTHALGGLTLLDTKQGGEGMTLLTLRINDLQTKAITGFMAMMEQIHAKSYSSIFTTLCTTDEIDNIFNWVDSNELLSAKANIITSHYDAIDKKDFSKEDLWKAMMASVLLETYLFYSGFYYPLYLSGQGKMTSCGEIIDLILRDESIHGLFIGIKAQELYEEFNIETQEELYNYMIKLVIELNKIEERYSDELYSKLGINEDVKNYVKYNANKAFMNLGFEPYYKEINDNSFNPIVLNGINTGTKQHDFFSKKGNGYVKALNVVPLTDADFNFEGRL